MSEGKYSKGIMGWLKENGFEDVKEFEAGGPSWLEGAIEFFEGISKEATAKMAFFDPPLTAYLMPDGIIELRDAFGRPVAHMGQDAYNALVKLTDEKTRKELDPMDSNEEPQNARNEV